MGLLGGFIGALVGADHLLSGFPIYRPAAQTRQWAWARWRDGYEYLDGQKAREAGELGGITAVLVGWNHKYSFKHFVALGWWHKEAGEVMDDMHSIYDTRMVEAKEVAKVGADRFGCGDTGLPWQSRNLMMITKRLRLRSAMTR